MDNIVSFQYINDKYQKLERSLKKYNMLAYKKLIFEYYPNMKAGKFPGKLVFSKKEIDYYELELPTDSMFAKVYGVIILKYSYNRNLNVIMLETIEPEEFLLEGHKNELIAYKGVPISKDNNYKDMFKINLLKSFDEPKSTMKKKIKKVSKDTKLSNVKFVKRKLGKYEIDDSIYDTYKRISNEIDELDKKRKILKQKLNNLSNSDHALIKDVLIDLYKLQKDNNPKKLDSIIKGIEYNLDLRKNMTSKIDPVLRDKSIKKLFQSAKNSGRVKLTKYWRYKNKIEFTDSYIGFVLNNIDSDYEEGAKIDYKLQDIIKDSQKKHSYQQVDFDIIEFYKNYDKAIFDSDDEFMYYIDGVCVNGFYLKQALDILGTNIIMLCAGETDPILIKNVDGECSLIMPIKHYE